MMATRSPDEEIIRAMGDEIIELKELVRGMYTALVYYRQLNIPTLTEGELMARARAVLEPAEAPGD